MQTLSDLWRGKISPWEEKEEGYAELQRLISFLENVERDLISCLDEKEKNLFAKALNYRDDIEELERENAFIKGFCLSTRLFAEILATTKDF